MFSLQVVAVSSAVVSGLGKAYAFSDHLHHDTISQAKYSLLTMCVQKAIYFTFPYLNVKV
jgi:hypothetical protein